MKKQRGNAMTDDADRGNGATPLTLKRSNWWRNAGFVASGLAGAAAVAAFRGCWHGKMSWPVCAQGYSYQVCLRCGAIRLFNERTFSSYGPYRNDLDELIAWEKSTNPESDPRANVGSTTP
jgi:hypothetical protein